MKSLGLLSSCLIIVQHVMFRGAKGVSIRDYVRQGKGHSVLNAGAAQARWSVAQLRTDN